MTTSETDIEPTGAPGPGPQGSAAASANDGGASTGGGTSVPGRKGRRTGRKILLCSFRRGSGTFEVLQNEPHDLEVFGRRFRDGRFGRSVFCGHRWSNLILAFGYGSSRRILVSRTKPPNDAPSLLRGPLVVEDHEPQQDLLI